MKSYTYKLVNWDNCPDVRVNIDVSQDLWQPYFWLRLRREFLSGNQSVLSFFAFFAFPFCWLPDSMKMALNSSTHKAWRMKHLSVSSSSLQWKQRPRKQAIENTAKNLISPENFCPLAFIICISDIVCPQAALLQKFTIWRNCFFFTLSSITPPKNQIKNKHKIKFSPFLSHFSMLPYLFLKNVNKIFPKFSRFHCRLKICYKKAF